jgi:hypothetical protein
MILTLSIAVIAAAGGGVLGYSSRKRKETLLIFEEEQQKESDEKVLLSLEKKAKEQKEKELSLLIIPHDLGIKQNTPYTNALKSFVEKMDESMSDSYKKQIKERVLKHTKWSEKEYDVYWYGMKQFFLLSAVMKSVPMYSEKVDDIWHEMLMFTRDYEAFCQTFAGEMIHHTPTTSTVENPIQQRAKFDWLYSQFFEVNETTEYMYGTFFLHTLEKDYIKELEKSTVSQLQTMFFKEKEETIFLAKAVTTNLQKQLFQAKVKKQINSGRNYVNSAKRGDNDDFIINSLLVSEVVDSGDSGSSTKTSSHDSSCSSSPSHSSCKSCSSCSSSSCSSSSCSSCSS